MDDATGVEAQAEAKATASAQEAQVKEGMVDAAGIKVQTEAKTTTSVQGSQLNAGVADVAGFKKQNEVKASCSAQAAQLNAGNIAAGGLEVTNKAVESSSVQGTSNTVGSGQFTVAQMTKSITTEASAVGIESNVGKINATAVEEGLHQSAKATARGCSVTMATANATGLNMKTSAGASVEAAAAEVKMFNLNATGVSLGAGVHASAQLKLGVDAFNVSVAGPSNNSGVGISTKLSLFNLNFSLDGGSSFNLAPPSLNFGVGGSSSGGEESAMAPGEDSNNHCNGSNQNGVNNALENSSPRCVETQNRLEGNSNLKHSGGFVGQGSELLNGSIDGRSNAVPSVMENAANGSVKGDSQFETGWLAEIMNGNPRLDTENGENTNGSSNLESSHATGGDFKLNVRHPTHAYGECRVGGSTSSGLNNDNPLDKLRIYNSRVLGLINSSISYDMEKGCNAEGEGSSQLGEDPDVGDNSQLYEKGCSFERFGPSGLMAVECLSSQDSSTTVVNSENCNAELNHERKIVSPITDSAMEKKCLNSSSDHCQAVNAHSNSENNAEESYCAGKGSLVSNDGLRKANQNACTHHLDPNPLLSWADKIMNTSPTQLSDDMEQNVCTNLTEPDGASKTDHVNVTAETSAQTKTHKLLKDEPKSFTESFASNSGHTSETCKGTTNESLDIYQESLIHALNTKLCGLEIPVKPRSDTHCSGGKKFNSKEEFKLAVQSKLAHALGESGTAESAECSGQEASDGNEKPFGEHKTIHTLGCFRSSGSKKCVALPGRKNIMTFKD